MKFILVIFRKEIVSIQDSTEVEYGKYSYNKHIPQYIHIEHIEMDNIPNIGEIFSYVHSNSYKCVSIRTREIDVPAGFDGIIFANLRRG